MDNLKPEELIEIKLWSWLKTNKKHIKDIYFNRQCYATKELCAKVFTTKGINKKPDFLIELDWGEFIAVEIKDASKSKNVYDAGKILDIYLNNYHYGLTKYYINDIEIKISTFVIATENSELGRLFKEEHDCIIRDNIKESTNDQWRKVLATRRHEPFYEYQGTSQFQRNLFSLYKRYRALQDDKFKEKGKEYPALGILISNIYEDGSTKKEPYLFTMKWKNKSFWQADYSPI